jgi:hypothetical protein
MTNSYTRWAVFFGQARPAHGLARPLRAAFLVVVASWVVKGVMKPDRQRNLGRSPRVGARQFELIHHLPQVPQRVIAAVGFAPAAYQLPVQGIAHLARAQFGPDRAPGGQIDHDPRSSARAAFTALPSSITARA